MKKIRNLEAEVQRLLAEFSACPPNRQPKVTFRRPDQDNRRSIREDADASYFEPEKGCYIRVEFVERVAEEQRRADNVVPAPRGRSPRAAHGPERVPSKQRVNEPAADDGLIGVVVRALDGAERAPNRTFVAIKTFRDQILMGEGLGREQAGGALNRAIEMGLVKTSKIPNPHHPEFPTTTLRLDRTDPRVKSILQAHVSKLPRPRFTPVDFGPVSASEVVIRDRR